MIAFIGRPCDREGNDLFPGSPPPPPPPPRVDDDGEPSPYFPFDSCREYMLAHFLFKRNQMPGTDIDELMQIWAIINSDERDQERDPPFSSREDLYGVIDATTLGEVPWQSFSVTYTGELPAAERGDPPPWMLDSYDVWFRDPRLVLQNQLGNPDYRNEFDYAPFQKFGANGEREWKDFMSGNWGYQQAVCISRLASLSDVILTIDRI
jgi:hypothetical protein